MMINSFYMSVLGQERSKMKVSNIYDPTQRPTRRNQIGYTHLPTQLHTTFL